MSQSSSQGKFIQFSGTIIQQVQQTVGTQMCSVYSRKPSSVEENFQLMTLQT